ncbi:hypothetical protein SEA_AGEOFDAPAGE_62 [Mycobacterium phage Ageofdapage]|nr:hypothetical protein SEA_AGEOFDAPAGE_62 [Mycobacterium phage Ageofdapage]
MSNNNFVHVGKVTVEPARLVGGVRKAGAEVIVGVRADLGEVVVNVANYQHTGLPRLSAHQAAVLAGLVERASVAASSLAEAYQTYQATLQQAEADLEQAFAQEASA